jgi:hypothetical protein
VTSQPLSSFERSFYHPEEIRKNIKDESGSQAIGQPPKTEQMVDPGADLWDRGQQSI